MMRAASLEGSHVQNSVDHRRQRQSGPFGGTAFRSHRHQGCKFDLPGSEGAHCEPRHAVVLGDMQDQSLLEDTLTAYKPDMVIHLASMLSGSSQANPQLAWEVNATSSIRLMSLCLDRNIGPFFFASTAATYGPDLASPVP